MNPPAEAHPSEKLAHAVESLRRSDRPLTAREIVKSIPPPSRMDPRALEPLLKQDARVIPWPSRTRSAPPRYWTRQPQEIAGSVLMDLLADRALTASDLQRKMGRHLAGFSTTEKRALVESQVDTLLAAGRLYRHPPPGKGKPKYSAKPAKATDYVAKLQKELDALVAKLTPDGITREQILEALRGERPLAELPQRIARRITEYLKSKPGGIEVGRLRRDLGLSLADKAAFDEAVLSLYRQRHVYLDRHDWPAGLNQAEKDELVTDGRGNYFVVIALRDADAESIS
jgi:hypothetical protein